MSKKRNVFALFIILFGLVGVVLWVLSWIVKTGARLEGVIPYIEYVYYVCAGLLVVFLIIKPTLEVLFSPSYSLEVISKKLEGPQKEKIVKKNYKQLKKMAKRLISKKLVDDSSINMLSNELKVKDKELVVRYSDLKDLIDRIVDKSIKKDIKKIVVDNAKNTLYLTSLSQNSVVDLLIVIVTNFRMLKQIVIRCGYRPSFVRLLKFYLNVSFHALVADGVQKMDLSSLLSDSVKGLAKPVVGSLLEGSVNAFFMLRSGFLAKNYILEEYSDVGGKERITSSAFLEAASVLPDLTIATVVKPIAGAISSTVVSPTKKAVKKLFSKKEKLEIES